MESVPYLVQIMTDLKLGPSIISVIVFMLSLLLAEILSTRTVGVSIPQGVCSGSWADCGSSELSDRDSQDGDHSIHA